MMFGSLLCRFGYHHPVPAPLERHVEIPGITSLTNAVCLRCNQQSWMNWPPENPGDGSMPDLINRIENLL